MLKKIFGFIGLALLVLIAIILFRTFGMKSKQPRVTIVPAVTTPDSALIHLQHAISYKTISVSDSLPPDTAAFKAYHSFLQKAYPLVFSKLTLERYNDFALLFTWTGKNPSLAPAVIMAH